MTALFNSRNSTPRISPNVNRSHVAHSRPSCPLPPPTSTPETTPAAGTMSWCNHKGHSMHPNPASSPKQMTRQQSNMSVSLWLPHRHPPTCHPPTCHSPTCHPPAGAHHLTLFRGCFFPLPSSLVTRSKGRGIMIRQRQQGGSLEAAARTCREGGQLAYSPGCPTTYQTRESYI